MATLEAPAKKPKRPRVPPPIQHVLGEPVHIGGLDASTKRIGYAAPNGTTHSIVADKMPLHPRPFDLAVRCNQLRHGLARAMRLNPPVPELMVYERAFTRFAGSSARLDELRGVLRDLLVSWPTGPIAFVDIDNQLLKTFASGKNTADKTLMRHQAECTIAAEGLTVRPPRNDDETDGWWLRRMGRVGCGLEPTTAGYQVDVLAAETCRVLWVPT
jgi:hypothetical protein